MKEKEEEYSLKTKSFERQIEDHQSKATYFQELYDKYV